MIAALPEATGIRTSRPSDPGSAAGWFEENRQGYVALWFDKLNPAKVNIGWADYGERSTLSDIACGRYDVFAFQYVCEF